MKIVYDRTFPPSMTDFSTFVREVQATNPDLVVVGTQPGQSINVARAIAEVGLNAQMIGGAMTGLQTTDSETILGPQINGLVNFAYWLPAPKLQFPGSMEFLSKYQARAKAEGVDPIGYYVAPWAYADLQILAAAVEATKSLEGDKLGPYIHANTFKTIIGDVQFGPGGEWAKPRQFLIQFQNVKSKDAERVHGHGPSGRRRAAGHEDRRAHHAVRQGAPVSALAAAGFARCGDPLEDIARALLQSPCERDRVRASARRLLRRRRCRRDHFVRPARHRQHRPSGVRGVRRLWRLCLERTFRA